MSHHFSPQRLHLLRFFFFAFTSTFSKNSQGSKSRCMPVPIFEYPVRTPGVPPERNTRRQSRIPGIPVQSLNFPESAPIPAGIPDP